MRSIAGTKSDGLAYASRRSDIHTLFDLDLLGIEPERLEIQLHPSVAVEYADVAAGTLTCSDRHSPSEDALRRRYERFRQSRLDPAG